MEFSGDSKSISRVGNAETRRLLKRPNVAQKRETPEDKESHGGRAVKRRKEVVVAVVKVRVKYLIKIKTLSKIYNINYRQSSYEASIKVNGHFWSCLYASISCIVTLNT